MFNKKHLLNLFIASIIFFILTACSNNGNGEDSGSTSTQKATEDKILTIGVGADIETFDVHDHGNTPTETIHVNLYSYLFKRDDSGEPKGELVESYDQVDGLTWEMTLKDGITFHNGDPLTSEDVKFTLERVATDSSLIDHPNYKQIKEVDIIDDHTFRVITHDPDPSLLYRLSRVGSGIMPKDYIEENGLDHFLQNPIGTGPYQFVEWVRDSHITFKPYEDYALDVDEEWDEVVFRIIPENSTRVSELLTGGIDIAENVPPHQIDQLESNGDINVITGGDTSRVMILVARQSDGYVTQDPKLLEAIDYAIDVNSIIENILGGSGVPTLTRIVEGVFGSHEDLYDNYNYDKEYAKQLVDESSYSGEEITLHSPQGRYLQDKEVAEMITAMLNEVGINVKLNLMEWNTFLEMRNAKENEELYFIGFGISLGDAQQALDYYTKERGEGETDYYNEEVEELLNASRVNMDEEERVEQLRRIQEIIAEDRPHITLYEAQVIYGVSDHLDFKPALDTSLRAEDIKRK